MRAAWVEPARAAFPRGRLASRAASPKPRRRCERLLDRLAFFLSLAGLTALLVGGVGIGNAVAGYIAEQDQRSPR